MKRILFFVLVIIIIFYSKSVQYAYDTPKIISIAFTNDIHSHLDSEKYIANDGMIKMRGGFARLKTLMNKIIQQNPDTFIFDAGDFSMGTPFHTLFRSSAFEIRMLGAIGYDATTFGNHEFDFKARGLAEMLNSAVASGDTLPLLFYGNIDWDKTLSNNFLKDDAWYLRYALENYGAIKNWKLVKKGNITTAVFGLQGYDSIACAPESGLIFKDPIEYAQDIVRQIKSEGKADMIICLSHSGTDREHSKSEDEILAAKIPEIDLIISGHTHTYIKPPIIIGNTYIVSSECYLHYLGHIILTQQENKRWKMQNQSDYKLYILDDKIPEDMQIKTLVNNYKNKIDAEYFSDFKYKSDMILANLPYDFINFNDFGTKLGENPLGNIVADSFIYAVKQAEGDSYEPIATAVEAQGVIRNSFFKGDITVTDAFNILSLGIGADGTCNYPLVNYYITGTELKNLAEVDISIGSIDYAAQLYFSGLIYKFNKNRLLFNRVTDLEIQNQKFESNKLYRVVTDLYICELTSLVSKYSHNLLKIIPKDKNGDKIIDFNKFILHDSDGNELKTWSSLAGYIQSLGTIPDSYSSNQGRKIESNKCDLVSLFKQPNHVFWLMILIIFAGLTVIIITIFLFTSSKKRKSRKKIKNI